jgi:DNA-binding response OmpR family regulator
MLTHFLLSGRVDTVFKTVQRKRHILIVETDDLIRGLLDQWLREAGYHVVIANPRRIPQERARVAAPDLVIADIPDPHRAEKRIHQLREVYASRILVLSGRFRRGLRTSGDVAHRLGVSKVLPKPFSRSELLAAVDEAIESV